MAKLGDGKITRLATGVAAALLLVGVSASATVAVRPATTDLPMAVSTASVVEPIPPPETAFVQTEHRTRPALLAEGVAALDAVPADQGWRAVWNARGLSFGEMLHAAATAPMLVPIVVVGGVLIVVASLARRRRRRRIGWGLLPERQRAPRPRS